MAAIYLRLGFQVPEIRAASAGEGMSWLGEYFWGLSLRPSPWGEEADRRQGCCARGFCLCILSLLERKPLNTESCEGRDAQNRLAPADGYNAVIKSMRIASEPPDFS